MLYVTFGFGLWVRTTCERLPGRNASNRLGTSTSGRTGRGTDCTPNRAQLLEGVSVHRTIGTAADGCRGKDGRVTVQSTRTVKINAAAQRIRPPARPALSPRKRMAAQAAKTRRCCARIGQERRVWYWASDDTSTEGYVSAPIARGPESGGSWVLVVSGGGAAPQIPPAFFLPPPNGRMGTSLWPTPHLRGVRGPVGTVPYRHVTAVLAICCVIFARINVHDLAFKKQSSKSCVAGS